MTSFYVFYTSVIVEVLIAFAVLFVNTVMFCPPPDELFLLANDTCQAISGQKLDLFEFN